MKKQDVKKAIAEQCQFFRKQIDELERFALAAAKPRDKEAAKAKQDGLKEGLNTLNTLYNLL